MAQTTPNAPSSATLATPPTSSPRLTLLSPAESYATVAKRLENIGILLHGLHRRHKNQHRVSTYWWPAFGQLRRHVRKLAAEARAVWTETTPDRPARETDAKRRVAAHARDMYDCFIPKVYLYASRVSYSLRLASSWTLFPLTFSSAFSRLVADRRHAQLGLLLMGVLAQVHTVLRQVTNDGPTKEENVGAKGRDGLDMENVKDNDMPPTTTLKLADDFGEIVARDGTDGKGYGKDKAERVSSKGLVAAVAQPTKKHPRPKDDDEYSVEKASVGIRSTCKEPSAKATPEKKTKTKTREVEDIKDEDRKEKREKREKKDKDQARKTKKRKKTGDEFDDLFDGLL
ncbi:Ribonuclease MRP protein subunit rmp1 [Sporothrix epigloea]|uniref:Ribonuclease MRP protein subunit rmp1 n=1 Tax=Sporothrix epigloea TaxID=1892477 RepID=A0ABP0DTE5_9PEZI